MSKKLIIDTDPGIDDAMAILFALSSSELNLLGITTVFGNVNVNLTTQNALRILEIARRRDIPVAKGAEHPLTGVFKEPSDYVHGEDGLGNTHLPGPKGSAVSRTAAQFIIEQVRKYPGEVTLAAIGAWTNLALALQQEPSLVHLVKQVVLMGGAFRTNGNINPAAEANVYADPQAADAVLTAGWPVTVVGLDVTSKVIMSDDQLTFLRDKSPRYGEFIYRITRFYLEYYLRYRSSQGINVHDPSVIAWLLKPELFESVAGAVRVATDGLARGKTILDEHGQWAKPNQWLDKPKVVVCVGVDAQGVVDLFMGKIGE